MIEVNVDQAVAELRHANRDLYQGIYEDAVRRALNESITRGRRNLGAIIIRHYNSAAFTPTAVRSGLIIERARRGKLTARIWVSGKPLPITYFSPRQTPQGITVEIIKGRRKLLRSAFRVKFGGKGTRWVVGRGQYGSGRFSWRKERLKPYPAPDLPVGKLMTTSLPGTLTSEITQPLDELSADLQQYYPTRLAHNVQAIRLGHVNPRIR